MSEPQQQAINLSKLDAQQLSLIKQDLEEELQQLTSQLQTLRSLSSRFRDLKDSLLSTAKPENNGKSILVPLTPSLFVPGQLASHDKFLVDIGTGYFVEKNAKDAESYYNRKLKLLDDSEQQVTVAIGQRRKNLETVTGFLQQRLRQQQQQQGGQVASS